MPGIGRRDARVTRVGRWLRRTSLDELPQLWNVVRGDMSLVGPRPHTVEEVATFPGGYLERYVMPPGITGLWQVSGRNSLSMKQMLELDVHYVATWRLRSDLRILALTPRTVARTSDTA